MNEEPIFDHEKLDVYQIELMQVRKPIVRCGARDRA